MIIIKHDQNIKGSHEVHLLTQQPIEVNENFIRKPTSSSDHLKAPDRFPEPEYQYTLREMSVVWHIYGGRDFSPPPRGSSSGKIIVLNSNSCVSTFLIK